MPLRTHQLVEVGEQNEAIRIEMNDQALPAEVIVKGTGFNQHLMSSLKASSTFKQRRSNSIAVESQRTRNSQDATRSTIPLILKRQDDQLSQKRTSLSTLNAVSGALEQSM